MRLPATVLLIVLTLPIPEVLPARQQHPPITSHIHRSAVESSAIHSIGYSRRLHALEIEFRNGAIYRYLDVPMQTYRELMAAASKASYYDTNIRHRYRSLHVKPRS